MGKVYDQAYKIEICKRAVEGGKAVSAISREVGISENTLYGWVARYGKNKEKPFVGSGHMRQLRSFPRENKELREENEILKKAPAYFARNQK